MKLSLRVRLLGTLIGAIVLFFLVSVDRGANATVKRSSRRSARRRSRTARARFARLLGPRRIRSSSSSAKTPSSDTLRKSVATTTGRAAGPAREHRAHVGPFVPSSSISAATWSRAPTGRSKGSLKSDPLITRALTGETVSTATLLDQSTLGGELSARKSKPTSRAPTASVGRETR